MKKYFLYKLRRIRIDHSNIFPMKPSEFQISITVASYDEKTAKILTKLLRCRKAHGFETINDINDPQFQ